MKVSRILALCLCLGFSGEALAHAHLKKTEPGVDATIGQSPGEIRLYFSEGVEPKLSKLSLTGPDGAPVAIGQPISDPADKAQLIVKLQQTLKPGAYKVNWRVISVDTHPTQGSFTFTIAP
ncbi:MAG TPA: copper homeostasis periplasmic binding protein CopC [Beijerinckia sp.]|nr:copper homeostasis periplasmic binding protein CopC [Beijerinckia sp.]